MQALHLNSKVLHLRKYSIVQTVLIKVGQFRKMVNGFIVDDEDTDDDMDMMPE